MATPERSKLYVEGTDDIHVVRHLLHRHGIDILYRHGIDTNKPENVPEIKETNGIEKLLGRIKTDIQVSNDRSVGFVLDADDTPPDRWSAVRGRLREVGMNPPETMPDNGYVDDSEKYRARVGVWLMPGNQQAGALEEFLADLVPEGNLLLELAKSSTEEARSKGATFPDSKRSKAVLHTWLAWQTDPGLPYGSAIKAHFFRHDSPVATAFITWYRRLFPTND
ncbi:MAG: hypothetical protein TH68_00535 [Candidatus Synechococcus spongiarum 142]|uniref:DUF4435 domain-containing protein n=1 Tax=Candidatus Synechococcus spongiarum 142 TaxID=1608213 RepID=A0A6N3X2U5_9SYNE|nr:MAG: hypothetical protein TH68_00535 [Candidatus Synechococcus spongiarum 142]